MSYIDNVVNRHELHYLLDGRLSSFGPTELKGSCVLFLAVDESEKSINYEIDSCTHDDIFPQKEAGSIRIGQEWAR